MSKRDYKDVKKVQELVNILGINLVSTERKRLLISISEKITHNNKFIIVTPNPEIVLASTRNKKLKNILNSSQFSVPDGVGLRFASSLLYGKSLQIIPGRILFEDLIETAAKRHWRVFLLGGLGSEAVDAETKIKAKYPNLLIKSSKGPRLNLEGQPASKVDRDIHSDIVKKINKFKPHLLFVAFGNPKQELFIDENLNDLSVNAAMTVGGAFRYVAGLSPEAPKLFQTLGLEWLWRLLTEPKRAGRIFNAVIVFPLKVFFWKLGFKVSNN